MVTGVQLAVSLSPGSSAFERESKREVGRKQGKYKKGSIWKRQNDGWWDGNNSDLVDVTRGTYMYRDNKNNNRIIDIIETIETLRPIK